MTQQPNDLRKQTLDLVKQSAPAGDNGAVQDLIAAWLGSLDNEDLAGTSPQALAPVLWAGFKQASKRVAQGCQVAQLHYDAGHGAQATALLIVNDDMPYLVDSIVMAMRKQRVGVDAGVGDGRPRDGGRADGDVADGGNLLVHRRHRVPEGLVEPGAAAAALGAGVDVVDEPLGPAG